MRDWASPEAKKILFYFLIGLIPKLQNVPLALVQDVWVGNYGPSSFIFQVIWKYAFRVVSDVLKIGEKSLKIARSLQCIKNERILIFHIVTLSQCDFEISFLYENHWSKSSFLTDLPLCDIKLWIIFFSTPICWKCTKVKKKSQLSIPLWHN